MFNEKSEGLTMCRAFKLEIIESNEALEEQIKKEKDVRKRERMQFLYWYKIGVIVHFPPSGVHGKL